MGCVPFAVNELRSAALMYEAELETKLAVADGLRSILGVTSNMPLPQRFFCGPYPLCQAFQISERSQSRFGVIVELPLQIGGRLMGCPRWQNRFVLRCRCVSHFFWCVCHDFVKYDLEEGHCLIESALTSLVLPALHVALVDAVKRISVESNSSEVVMSSYSVFTS